MTRHWIIAAAISAGSLSLCASALQAADYDRKSDRATDRRESVDRKIEATMPYDQAPAAVRETLKKEAEGNKIGTITKVIENGKGVYEADVTIEGKSHRIRVADDGRVLSNSPKRSTRDRDD
jgi:hypothetical protein